MERTAYIGVGANVASRAGSPAETARAAIEALAGLGEVMARSGLYETQPVGMTEQPVFVNAAVALKTAMEPEALLEGLLRIERAFGRDRSAGIAKGPRTLDLDLLMMDDAVMETAALTLPHPAMAERRFVLAPLAEIAAEVRHPVTGKTIAEMLDALADAGANARGAVRRLDLDGV